MVAWLFPYLMFCVWAAAIGITLFGTVAALLHLRRRPYVLYSSDEGLEPITILKPLKGMDEDVEENLESFFRLDYPRFEILFSVADSDDPIIPIVTKLIARYPKIPSRLVIGAIDFGPNPKINNLLRTYDTASFDWIIISDSNTRMPPHHLRRLAHQFKDGVAMQTSVVAGVEAHGLGGRLESTFLNTFYVRSVMALKSLGHPCVIGKAMLFRKSVLERIGGLRSLKQHIAEDYAAGRKLHMLGFRVEVSNIPIRQHIGRYTVRSFWSRHIRWGRLRKMQAPLAFLIEPLFNSLLSGVLGAVAFSALFGISPVVFLFSHMGIWFVCDAILVSRVGDKPDFAFLPVWLLRELIHFPLWVHISLGNTVVWRGNTIRLKKVRFLEARFYAVQDLDAFFRKKALVLPEIPEESDLDLEEEFEKLA